MARAYPVACSTTHDAIRMNATRSSVNMDWRILQQPQDEVMKGEIGAGDEVVSLGGMQ